ncbi:methyl-accepting chemotaxis protein [Anaerotignum sp.]|uniref:methyl-accepting chemotaxis protein n=1 Tax=Anaerotignum sp. TaxID=2039241 RepID=UPI0028A117BC|nr:HAMP domain-containing methyl-accepting chemotaxis protein [Anaerotignum sp.]
MGHKEKKGSKVSLKNLTVRWKLSVGFFAVFLILMTSIGTSVWGIKNVSDQITLYSKFTYPLTRANLSAQRDMTSCQRYLLLSIIQKDLGENYEDSLTLADESAKSFKINFGEFSTNQRNNANDANIAEIEQNLTKAVEARESIYKLLRTAEQQNAKQAYVIFQRDYLPTFNKIGSIMEQMNDVGDEKALQQKDAADRVVLEAWILLVVTVSIALLAVIGVIFVLTKAILTPVREIESAFREMAGGNLRAQISYESNDELGRMANSIRATNAMLSAYIDDISAKLGQLSRGDMHICVDLDYVGDFTAIKLAMIETTTKLNQTMLLISDAANQVNAGAGQVSDGAQALSSGATEQAATIEELNASITTVSEQAVQNATNVRQASEYVEQAGQGVEESNIHMQHLNISMKEIGESSQKISKITKLVEDIAFQTNILALNAAVEAARAGEAGKGFAVVADEVRNLAAKSAEAAKQTADLIQKSTETVAEGERLASETLKALDRVSEKARMVSSSIEQIEHASMEQAGAIEQICQGLTQVSAVVQTNAATAEESSAASEELAAQAQTLQEEVGKFRLHEERGVFSV